MNSVIPPSAICHPCIETPPDDRPVQADVLKERLIWRMEFETLDELGAQLAAYGDRYHHRPTRASTAEHRRRFAKPGTMPSSNH
jgi:hypothetical protein